MTTAVVKREVVDAVRMPKPVNGAAELIVREIGRTFAALPPGVDQEQFAHACVIAANEIERDCFAPSVLAAALNCAKLGLMPGKALGLAYFVPFKNKAAQRTDCQLIPGYRGLIDLAYSNGFLRSIHTDWVLQGEEFEQWNDERGPHFRHPKAFDREPTRQNIVAAYAWGDLMTGGSWFKLATKRDIESVYNEDSPAWRYSYPEMAAKTPIRRAAKQWKLTPRMALAVHLDEQAERGEPQAPTDGLVEAVNAPAFSLYAIGGEGGDE